ncbi:BCCT family transporter [Vibrio chagasii]|nr:BCCT family transporter [Vibrio chagasii]
MRLRDEVGVGPKALNGLQDITLSLFHTYDALPMSSVLSVVSIGLIMVFFITSFE